MKKKIDILIELMKANEWQKALSLASKFGELGIQKDDIKRAHQCYSNADFYRQIGKNPEELINKGIQALKDRYKDYMEKNGITLP